jgi:hypothetical protein
MADSLWHANVQDDPKFRQRMFETMVLHALWILIRCAFGVRPLSEALALRQTMVDYGDAIDPTDNPERRSYRRQHHYADLPKQDH